MNTTAEQNKTGFAFILIASLFFLWGFAHNLDPILIPHLKKSFTLNTTQSTSVDWVVLSVNDFFKCGMRIGSRLCAKPQRKNKEAIKIKAKPVLFCSAVVFIFSFW